MKSIDDTEERKKIVPATEIASEKLFEGILLSTLMNEKYLSLSYSRHVPLKSILPIPGNQFSKKEKHYLTHPWAHLDFVVYNKYDKKPILAIEIDGIAYHEQNKDQQTRDKLKDTYLNSVGLPILRFKTNESQIQERVAKELESILFKE